ncbi:MAG: S9 family peptidase [Cyanobacteria bacterium NC_groundwater_1444_Ag_S-0.65um_54_12]|nr:S9 family peptidase [Cyanobacteria bacterium NC_groundwater_1444_Ag_S-0.65um_54_12]
MQQIIHRSIIGSLITALALPTAAAVAGEQAANREPSYPIGQYLNIRGAAGGTFTPDSRAIIFSTNITGIAQLWRVSRTGGWPEQLTFFGDAVRGASRSPRGDWFLFGKDNGGDERQQLYLMRSDGSQLMALTQNPKVIHSFGAWSWDGKQLSYASNERNTAFFDVHVMDRATRQARRVVTHDGNNYPLAWARTGQSLVFTRVDTPSNQNLYWLDLTSGKERLLTPHQGNANYESVAFGQDGLLYLITDQDREYASLATLDPRNGNLRYLTPDTVEVESLELDKKGSKLAYLLNRDGYSELYLKPIGTSGSKRIKGLPSGVLSNLDWSPDSRYLLFTFSGPAHNSDIWQLDLAAETCQQVTRSTLAGIPRTSFAFPQLVRYRSFDNREIPAFVYLPKGAANNARLPVVVFIHGGPEGQERPDFASSFQYYLSRGYAIFAPNIRGSIGYGKSYTHLDDGRKRRDAIRDVEYAARYLKNSGYVDPTKIAIMGGSYGGYMTLAALTMLPDLWAAGVDSVGMSNLVSFLENTGPWRRALREAEYGSLTHDRDFLGTISPLNQVDKISAPLLVIQGANDPRVPKSEADSIVQALRDRGHPVEYLLFEDEGHGVAKLANRIKSFTATAEFLDKYVKHRAISVK